MDLQDQLKNLFPDHVPEPSEEDNSDKQSDIWLQDDPIICKYEKRKGKPITILEGYTGATEDFKKLAKELNFPEYRIVLLDKAFKQILGRSLPTKRELSLITGLIRKGLLALIK